MYTKTFRNLVRQAAATAGITVGDHTWTNETEDGHSTVIFAVAEGESLLSTIRRSVGSVVADDQELNLRVTPGYVMADCALSR